MDELIYMLPVAAGLTLIIGPPAAILVWLEPRWRVFAFFLGLALAAGNYWLILVGHNRGLPVILMELGIGVALAALLVEIPAFVIRTVKRERCRERRR